MGEGDSFLIVYVVLSGNKVSVSFYALSLVSREPAQGPVTQKSERERERESERERERGERETFDKAFFKTFLHHCMV